MFAAILATVSLLFVSEREQFWSSDAIAAKTQYARKATDGTIQMLTDEEAKAALDEMKNKRILVLVHGFDNADILPLYNEAIDNIEKWDSSLFDCIVGYVWPSCNSEWAYYKAKELAEKIAPRLRSFLEDLNVRTTHVDLVAMSMGNFLALETLNFQNPAPLVSHFFSICAAVPDYSIDQGYVFAPASQNYGQMYVFYSAKDPLLKWLYPLVEWNEALGYAGDVCFKKLPANIQVLDCTDFISSHTGYLDSKLVYNYIQKVKREEVPIPEVAADIKLLVDGDYTVTRYRK